jgi:L-ascorbate peroxidase
VLSASQLGLPPVEDDHYRVRLVKQGGERLGLDVDYMEGRTVLPIVGLCGGMAKSWNKANPHAPLRYGDAVVQVNSARDATDMLERCRDAEVLDLTLRTQLNYTSLVADLEKLIVQKRCGPIMVRLSFHDAAVYRDSPAAVAPDGRANAAMRFLDAGEAKFSANKGLPEVAIPLLSNISDKYCPDFITHADLWALAANVSIRLLGGPDVSTRFGRADAKSSAESVKSQAGRLPDAGLGAGPLRELFSAKGLGDREIVALSAAHALSRSAWGVKSSEKEQCFDNSYYKSLLQRFVTERLTNSPEGRCPISHVVMRECDLALVRDAGFREHVEVYAGDQDVFFQDFSRSWAKLQELGWPNLRDSL